MSLNDNFFEKVKQKTNVDKNTIYRLAEKLNNGHMKDENTIKEIIDTLSKMTGKSVSKETSDKIISKIQNDNIPKGIDKMF
ncbi:MAG: stage VI sporulation protein F [Bacilli bacterium]|nr:stage VI sporulation protein F [Bacilli bacterium]